MDVDPELVVFIFFNPEERYEEFRIRFERQKFECGMVVEDKLISVIEDESQFFVVLFSTNEEVKSSHLLKFSKDNE